MDATARQRLAWQLATEAVVVRIRWFGIAMGYVLVQTRTGLHNPSAVRAFLALGAGYAGLDTAYHRWGEVFLGRWPLLVASLEGSFIALLCDHDTGLASPFRWYYLLSLIGCAIRYRPRVAWGTFAIHCVSLATLAWAVGAGTEAIGEVLLTLMVLAWATWATSSLAGQLASSADRLTAANAALEAGRNELERRVEERTEALRAAQARVIHQEKMAAFGLLAAGIAHEVGNPLAAVSALVQMLQRRGPDSYSAEKLDEARRQLDRIRRTVRELVEFSRPASAEQSRVRIADVIEEALGIAKYAHRAKGRTITTDVPATLPAVVAPRDHLTQVVLNLVLNALDATERGGHVELTADEEGGRLILRIEDDGRGVDPADVPKLFQPYFTTKPRGTGLGLFVSREIVAELGGALDHQARPSGGSTFVVSLPPAPGGPVPAGVLAGEALA